jgi:hypothetical protein
LEIKLSNGPVSLIDDDDFKKVQDYKWFINDNGYVRGYKNWREKYVYLHRLILDASSMQQVDHINGNRLDNRKENLRITSQQQNTFNAGLRSNNKSGYKGVRLRKDTKRWSASITHNYKEISLGCFDTKEEAAEAYNRKALELFGEYARLNKIG